MVSRERLCDMKNAAAVNRRKVTASRIRRLVIERRVRMLRLGEMSGTV
jgi:hypothetical protein